jgi:hypothetical protein
MSFLKRSNLIQFRKMGRGQPKIYRRKRGRLVDSLLGVLANPDRDIFRRAVSSGRGKRVEDIVVAIGLLPNFTTPLYCEGERLGHEQPNRVRAKTFVMIRHKLRSEKVTCPGPARSRGT